MTAQAQGKVGGQPTVMEPDKLAAARALKLGEGGHHGEELALAVRWVAAGELAGEDSDVDP